MSDQTSDLFCYRGPDRPGEGYVVYKHLRDWEHAEEHRAYINEIWAQFRKLDLADPDFVDKFPAECPARIWEMRLASTLASWKFKLVPSPKRGAGMDFGIVLRGGRTVWVEATAPLPGEDGNPNQVSAPFDQVLYGAELNRTTALRYLGSIEAKRKQFARARDAGLVSSEDGLIIALSGSQIPMADVEAPGEPPLVVQMLFGMGPSPFLVELGSGQVRKGPPAIRPSFKKSSGSEVSSRLFCSPDAEEISGVLFDPLDVKNRPEARGRAAGEDFILVHNPFARLPLNVGQLPNGREFFIRLDSIDRRK